MTKWIGAAILALGLMSGGSAASVAAAPLQAGSQMPQASKATEISARHHPRYVYRRNYQPYDRYYYERPYYYAPAPFVPFNFGYGIWPWG